MNKDDNKRTETVPASVLRTIAALDLVNWCLRWGTFQEGVSLQNCENTKRHPGVAVAWWGKN